MASGITIDESGNKYGNWTVVDKSHQNNSGNWYWNCLCSCGRQYAIMGSHLRTGSTSKCRVCSGKDNGRKGLYAMSEGKDVYFIRCGDFVKIGSSDNVNRRVKNIQSYNPYTVTLLEVDKDEKFWHDVFLHRHHNGEWYYFPIN